MSLLKIFSGAVLGVGVLGSMAGAYFSRKDKKGSTCIRNKRQELGLGVSTKKDTLNEEQDIITSVIKHQNEESFNKCLSVDKLPNVGPNIKVIGVGGAGSNAIQSMMNSSLEGVHFICASTDVQTLQTSQAPTNIQLGETLTRGLGTGSNPEHGRDAALENINQIRDAIIDADIVFVVAGMGRGTGTGAAAIIAQVAQKFGALTIGVVTKPFAFEGEKCARVAEMGIAELRKHVNNLITIPNERLREIANKNDTLYDIFRYSDDVLYTAIRAILESSHIPSYYIDTDFADMRGVLLKSGFAIMGTGVATGEGRAREAAMRAITNPLLEDISIAGAKAVLINITAAKESFGLEEFTEAIDYIRDAACSGTGENVHIVIGKIFDPSLGDEMRITVIATGIESSSSCSASHLQQDTSKTNIIPVQRPRINFLVEQSSIDFKIPSFIRYAKGKVL